MHFVPPPAMTNFDEISTKKSNGFVKETAEFKASNLKILPSSRIHEQTMKPQSLVENKF